MGRRGGGGRREREAEAVREEGKSKITRRVKREVGCLAGGQFDVWRLVVVCMVDSRST